MSECESWTLVTGASRGIGHAVVERLVASGRHVVACARDVSALAKLEQRHPGRVIGLSVDLSVQGAGVRCIDQAERRAGALSELVLCAGQVCYEPLGHVTEQSLRAQLELNFITPFMMLQHAGMLLRARGGGSIVVIGSTLASQPAPLTSAYAASKAALISATRGCALELAPSVRVNAIAPGVVDTDMVHVVRGPLAQAAAAADVIAVQLEQLRTLHPLGRLGTPLDVAQAVLYLLDASWVTGSVLTVDGGLTLS
ncbi:MAG: oxidoreductase, short-chain dehydrogenase/reductase family [Myxococcaceae bacterium]|nr:oxidoreductase, short-chain dehydrogenase/reductase family [Myxococcaceae bacterium]